MYQFNKGYKILTLKSNPNNSVIRVNGFRIFTTINSENGLFHNLSLGKIFTSDDRDVMVVKMMKVLVGKMRKEMSVPKT